MQVVILGGSLGTIPDMPPGMIGRNPVKNPNADLRGAVPRLKIMTLSARSH
jgi:hypothetical protein